MINYLYIWIKKINLLIPKKLIFFSCKLNCWFIRIWKMKGRKLISRWMIL